MTSIIVCGVPISEWYITSIGAPFSAGRGGPDRRDFVTTIGCSTVCKLDPSPCWAYSSRDNLQQCFFSLFLRYRLIETLSRQSIEKLQCDIPIDGHQLASSCRQYIDWECNVWDMIVASILIISEIFPVINPFYCWCFVRLICNVIPAHDFSRWYTLHGRHTLIMLREKVF